MAMATDGKTLYVVNYDSNTMTAVRTRDMKVIQTVSTNAGPSASPTTRPRRASGCAATPAASWCSAANDAAGRLPAPRRSRCHSATLKLASETIARAVSASRRPSLDMCSIRVILVSGDDR